MSNLMYIWGITKKHKCLSWWENFMSGHITIGNLTIYGANAMNWAVNYRTKRWGVICFTLPVLARWQKWGYDEKKTFRWYFYLSPNGTPWASTFYRGNTSRGEKERAEKRKEALGHNFDAWNDESAREIMWATNNR